jgi:hypothetical protein
MTINFPSLKFGLVVSIGGGVPTLQIIMMSDSATW